MNVMKRLLWIVAAFSCGLCLPASRASAFSDPFSYYLSPVAAGGGGRVFTGSPADSYTCKSCHSGAPAPKAKVDGLPLAGYRPGARYEILVSWPGSTKISLALELTDAQGKAAGTIDLPPTDEIKAEEFCEPAAEMILAAQLNETLPSRQVINVPECGSKRVRFLWTAPATDVGQVWFAGSMVLSDGETDPYHDGVTDFGRILGSDAVASKTSGECSVAGPGTSAGSWSPWLLLAATLGLCWRRRRPSPAAHSGTH
jgi:hypothetical protein